jgi:glutamine amidotransferase PdxT
VKIGVLAVQGAFREHLATLAAIGVEGVAVRLPADLDDVAGLILPGGESTTMRQLIERWGLREPILALARSGKASGRDAHHLVVNKPNQRCHTPLGGQPREYEALGSGGHRSFRPSCR